MTIGQLLEFLGERKDNEHWWIVKNEDGEEGSVPSSYIIVKEEQSLPWLQAAALKSEEEERKVRVSRLAQQKAAMEGKGFGPAPKDVMSTLPPKVGRTVCRHQAKILMWALLVPVREVSMFLRLRGHWKQLYVVTGNNCMWTKLVSWFVRVAYSQGVSITRKSSVTCLIVNNSLL